MVKHVLHYFTDSFRVSATTGFPEADQTLLGPN